MRRAIIDHCLIPVRRREASHEHQAVHVRPRVGSSRCSLGELGDKHCRHRSCDGMQLQLSSVECKHEETKQEQLDQRIL